MCIFWIVSSQVISMAVAWSQTIASASGLLPFLFPSRYARCFALEAYNLVVRSFQYCSVLPCLCQSSRWSARCSRWPWFGRSPRNCSRQHVSPFGCASGLLAKLLIHCILPLHSQVLLLPLVLATWLFSDTLHRCCLKRQVVCRPIPFGETLSVFDRPNIVAERMVLSSCLRLFVSRI